MMMGMGTWDSSVQFAKLVVMKMRNVDSKVISVTL